jgi:hypothetical protein
LRRAAGTPEAAGQEILMPAASWLAHDLGRALFLA